MIADAIRLAATLNDVSLGRVGAATAEAAVRLDGTPHHVLDREGVLGLDPLSGTPLRLALAGVERCGLTSWRLSLPRPGRFAGLRGPAEVNREAVEVGAAIVDTTGRCWLPYPVGEAMQWTLVRANSPLSAPQVAEAAELLNHAIITAERALTDLGMSAGTRPDPTFEDLLGEFYPRANHTLLARALSLHEASEAGLEATGDVLTAFGADVRERELRTLDLACLDAIEAAVSNPL